MLNQFKPQRRSVNYAAPELRCMNCARVIVEPMPGIYGRRFCTMDCRDEYLEKGSAHDVKKDY